MSLKPHPFSTANRLLAATSWRKRLIAASQATAESFRGPVLQWFGKHVPQRVVLNAIEPENFEFDPANRRMIREELNLSDDEFVLGLVGQITPRKGQLELIPTFAKARKRMPSSTLFDYRRADVQPRPYLSQRAQASRFRGGFGRAR